MRRWVELDATSRVWLRRCLTDPAVCTGPNGRTQIIYSLTGIMGHRHTDARSVESDTERRSTVSEGPLQTNHGMIVVASAPIWWLLTRYGAVRLVEINDPGAERNRRKRAKVVGPIPIDFAVLEPSLHAPVRCPHRPGTAVYAPYTYRSTCFTANPSVPARPRMRRLCDVDGCRRWARL